MDASRGVGVGSGKWNGNGDGNRTRCCGRRLVDATWASSTRSARDARRRALGASARRLTLPATGGFDGGAGAVSDVSRGGYRRDPGVRRGSLRRAGAPRGGRRARRRAGDASSSARGILGWGSTFCARRRRMSRGRRRLSRSRGSSGRSEKRSRAWSRKRETTTGEERGARVPARD